MEADPPTLLTVNARSSSIKAALFEAAAHGIQRSARAEVTGIRKQASLVTEGRDTSRDTSPLPGVRTHDDAMVPLLTWVETALGGRRLTAVGHRIVHGGDTHRGPVLATLQGPGA